MLPSSFSQSAKFGQINHYKKFWLLQTQVEKQEQNASTALTLGVAGNANVKEGKPLISASALVANGDHLINNVAGHGSCRGDIVTSNASSSTAGAFQYCSNEPAGGLKYYTGHTHISTGSLRDSPALSLAVNCTSDSVAHPLPITSFNQAWSPSTSAFCSPSSERLHLDCNRPNSVSLHTCISGQVKASSGPEECDSSEWRHDGRGDKDGFNISISPSSTISLFTKQHQEASDPPFNDFSSVTPSSLAALLSPLRGGLGCTAPLRTCSLCGTTKTPLWRSGPDGPKSLCNACGIRVKKAKRLQAAAMEAAGGGLEGMISTTVYPAAGAYKRLLGATKTTGKGKPAQKRKFSMEAAEAQSDPIFQLRKKERKAVEGSWAPPSIAGLDSGTCYRACGDAPTNLASAAVGGTSSKKAMCSLLAQDVEEAAVLLMALSCGLVLS